MQPFTLLQEAQQWKRYVRYYFKRRHRTLVVDPRIARIRIRLAIETIRTLELNQEINHVWKPKN